MNKIGILKIMKEREIVNFKKKISINELIFSLKPFYAVVFVMNSIDRSSFPFLREHVC